MINQLFAVMLLGLCAMTVQADHIKKTASGICHGPESSYYNRIKNYTPYHDIQTCLNPDGRINARSKESVPDYNRLLFGRSWADDDRDGQNTRAEILIDLSVGQIHFSDSRNKYVARGKWRSLFTDDALTDASTIDIDHLVPLKYAWTHGAYKWDYDRRKEFANDYRNLLIVESYLNRSKGAKGPDQWLPEKNTCEYILKFERVLLIYKLPVTQEIRDVKTSIC